MIMWNPDFSLPENERSKKIKDLADSFRVIIEIYRKKMEKLEIIEDKNYENLSTIISSETKEEKTAFLKMVIQNIRTMVSSIEAFLTTSRQAIDELEDLGGDKKLVEEAQKLILECETVKKIKLELINEFEIMLGGES